MTTVNSFHRRLAELPVTGEQRDAIVRRLEQLVQAAEQAYAIDRAAAEALVEHQLADLDLVVALSEPGTPTGAG